MSRLTTFLTALWLSAASAQLGILKNIQKGATNEVQAVMDPVGKGIAFVGNSQCGNVKKLTGVDYDSYSQEPDMSKLALVFISRSISVTYNLSDAARLIPLSRGFNPNNPFRIFLHGFTDDPTKDSYKNISNAFLAQGDCNILALDASSLIRWLYLRSTTMTRFIGEKLGAMLAALVNAGVDPSNIHLIGHSLGSHISGFTGKTFRNLTGTLIGRISGLDPAGPCFADLEVALRLSKEDAEFVDVIHTDAGVYGLDEEIGHVDFYPNSGSEQPNCLFQTCSHSRAWLLYAESVLNRDAFLAAKCTDYEDFRKGQCDYNDTRVMGYFCPPDSRGKYYLQTADEIPYGRGSEGLKYVNNAGIVRNIKYVLTG
ncbi:phospholipase A1-like [Helicoverpa zea]|uniref:phospholipase A1-like n=1 Tax=Helicoverpa zea TaxID=7113 RepID=UPI001F58F22E|nr:phospholipase A1-like [Helicoverpa zea]XP_047035737.1 phospholipase A1-like [Helicoverpa zea]